MTKVPDHYREESAEVFYVNSPMVRLDDRDLAFLREQAARSPSGRCRLCFHESPGAPVHEMLIAHRRDTYVRPHMHVNRSESFQVIDGEATAVLFSEDGAIERSFRMTPPSGGGDFYYHLPGNTYHSLLIETEMLLFFEVTTGPFDPAKTHYPEWAPRGEDADAVATFTADLRRQTGKDAAP